MSAFDFITKNSIRRKTKATRPKRRPQLRKLSEFKRLLVIAENNKSELLQPLNKVFKTAKIDFLYIRSTKEDESEKGKYSVHLVDFNLTGKSKNEKLTHLLRTPFDLILDLSTENELLAYLLQQVNSGFIIGQTNAANAFMYDLMVAQSSDELAFIKTVEEQLKRLTTNDTK